MIDTFADHVAEQADDMHETAKDNPRFCYHERHDEPCPLPCPACEEECRDCGDRGAASTFLVGVDVCEAPITHRVKYEDSQGEPLDDWYACTSKEEALDAYHAVIVDADPEISAVCVTELTDHDEITIAAHTFP